MEITIKEIESSIKNVFEESEVLNTDSVYEKIDDSSNLKLVIFINKLFDADVSVLYTKLIFVVDSDKKKLVNNSFLYLYDINCQYTNVDFSDTDDFENRLRQLIEKKNFGPNLKTLSKFIENPAFLINEWLKNNKTNEINVLSIKYDPKMYIMPCKSLDFTFNINVNNIDIKFSIKKEKDGLFIYSFHINDDITTIEKPNLKTLVDTIGTVLKNNFS